MKLVRKATILQTKSRFYANLIIRCTPEDDPVRVENVWLLKKNIMFVAVTI